MRQHIRTRALLENKKIRATRHLGGRMLYPMRLARDLLRSKEEDWNAINRHRILHQRFCHGHSIWLHNDSVPFRNRLEPFRLRTVQSCYRPWTKDRVHDSHSDQALSTSRRNKTAAPTPFIHTILPSQIVKP
jgi:hypothetical protein